MVHLDIKSCNYFTDNSGGTCFGILDSDSNLILEESDENKNEPLYYPFKIGSRSNTSVSFMNKFINNGQKYYEYKLEKENLFSEVELKDEDKT